jgi:hypothetical protein
MFMEDQQTRVMTMINVCHPQLLHMGVPHTQLAHLVLLVFVVRVSIVLPWV